MLVSIWYYQFSVSLKKYFGLSCEKSLFPDQWVLQWRNVPIWLLMVRTWIPDYTESGWLWAEEQAMPLAGALRALPRFTKDAFGTLSLFGVHMPLTLRAFGALLRWEPILQMLQRLPRLLDKAADWVGTCINPTSNSAPNVQERLDYIFLKFLNRSVLDSKKQRPPDIVWNKAGFTAYLEGRATSHHPGVSSVSLSKQKLKDLITAKRILCTKHRVNSFFSSLI